MKQAFLSFDQVKQQSWQAIIIGAGMGGSAAAYQLAQRGVKVLLIEKGLSSFQQHQGVEVEQEDPQERLQNGKWPTPLTTTVDGQKADIWAPLGCGLGGSTLLYAAALQRLRPVDFTEQKLPSGQSVRWPYSYTELSPYYQQAENLFSVCGTPDPLSKAKDKSPHLKPPPAMCEADQHYFQHFQQSGLNPFRLHVGVKYMNPCGECGGHICAKSCKQDASNACIYPAIETGNLFILEQAEVLSLDADKSAIKSVQVRVDQVTAALTADVFILSAGAYFSPVLLLRSSNQDWPQGLANESGLVGKNLMFHASEFIAFWPKHKVSREGPNKNIAFSDFYRHEGENLGEFQSTGLAAGYGNVVYALRLLFDKSPLRKLGFLRHFLRIPAYIVAKLFGDATIFTTIVEDYPYEENRILVDENTASGMRFEYTIHGEFKRRVKTFTDLVRRRVRNLKSLSMTVGVTLNYGHPCGTCKSGSDPKTSVVDAYCKAHGLENLYITDASFMPTSGGTNPSLTIAANALRVADHLADQFISKT